MPESIPAPLIIDTLKDTFREARAALVAEGWPAPPHPWLGWILSVPDTHQKTVLAALDKEEAIRVLTCATEDEANAGAATALRGWPLEGRVRFFSMIGLLSGERDKDPRGSRHSMVRYCEPL